MVGEENMANRTSEFWGICCEGGKKYSQVVRQKFHMTMAALDPTVVPTSPVVSLMVDRGGCEYLLCSLKPGTLLQVNLNLYFDKGEKVTFSLVGKGKIHLSGYHIYDKNDKSLPATKEKEMKNSQTNTMTAVPTKTKDKQKESLTVKGSSGTSNDHKVSKKDESVSPKKSKVEKKSKNNESDDDSEDDDSLDDLEDDDDDDDSSEDEESEEGTKDNVKDANRLKSYKRLWSSLTQSEEDSDGEDSDEDSDDSSEKNGKELKNKKRAKKENSKVVLNEKSGKNTPGKSISVEDVKSVKSPKQDLLNSSIGRTPMPQKKNLKENMTNSSKTVTPKKVNFVDIVSSNSENEDDTSPLSATPNKMEQLTTPSSETKKKRKKKKKNQSTPDDSKTSNESPAQPKGLSSATYSQKLPGGLEYEDIRVGNGPIAKKGRLVHVYYTGMLANNKVFDSREIGNKPFSFKLGSNQVIKGWDMAVEGMKVGGKRRMKIPPSLGYSSARTGPIPPNSTLYFTVELKAVS